MLEKRFFSERAPTERLIYERPCSSADTSFCTDSYSRDHIKSKDIHLGSHFTSFLLDIWYDQHFMIRTFPKEQQALDRLLLI
jgi:hypothetical protein